LPPPLIDIVNGLGVRLKSSPGRLVTSSGASGHLLQRSRVISTHPSPLERGDCSLTFSFGKATAGAGVLGRFLASCVAQHVIRQAMAVARLIGVPAPVHMRQVERPDGPQRTARCEEFAD
jgi:hypothetical protein